MTALAELAAFDTLDAKTIDRLLAQHLVETFGAYAVPDEPVDLEVALDDAGATLAWRDPGVDTFHAAGEFHWSVWEIGVDEDREVTAGISYSTVARADFAVGYSTYELRVYAANQCPAAASLESATTHQQVSFPASVQICCALRPTL